MDTNDLNLPRLGASSTPRLLRNRALLHSDETDRIIAAGIEVHRALGPVFRANTSRQTGRARGFSNERGVEEGWSRGRF